MEILVAIIIIALIAVVAYLVMQRRGAGAGGLGRRPGGGSPLPRQRSRAIAHRDPMAQAVHEHAQATDPHDAVIAEQNLQAQARQKAAGLTAQAHHGAAAEHQRAAGQTAYGDDGAYAAPATNPAYAPTSDPGYAEPGYADQSAVDRRDDRSVPADYDNRDYDGRRAEDWEQPNDPIDPGAGRR